MMFHRNAKLGLAGRFALVQAIESRMSLKAAAAAFSVSSATSHRWWHRPLKRRFFGLATNRRTQFLGKALPHHIRRVTRRRMLAGWAV